MTDVRDLAPPHAPTEPSYIEPGSLGIKERRSWATWQLLVAIGVAIVVGMMIGHSGGGKKQAGEAKGVFALPPNPSGGGSGSQTTPTTGSDTTPTTTGSSTTISGKTGTTAKAGATSSPTTAAASGSTPTVPPGPSVSSGTEGVLVPKTTGKGSQSLPSFNTADGEWRIGWAFRCSGATPFQVFVVPEGGQAQAQPAVDKQGPTGQGVTPQTSTGRQHLEVRSAATCAWAIKVTGVAA